MTDTKLRNFVSTLVVTLTMSGKDMWVHVQPPLEQHLTEPSLIILPKMLMPVQRPVFSVHIDKHTVYILSPEIWQTGAFVKEFKMYFSAILYTVQMKNNVFLLVAVRHVNVYLINVHLLNVHLVNVPLPINFYIVNVRLTNVHLVKISHIKVCLVNVHLLNVHIINK
jgi:hypothetical protein